MPSPTWNAFIVRSTTCCTSGMTKWISFAGGMCSQSTNSATSSTLDRFTFPHRCIPTALIQWCVKLIFWIFSSEAPATSVRAIVFLPQHWLASTFRIKWLIYVHLLQSTISFCLVDIVFSSSFAMEFIVTVRPPLLSYNHCRSAFKHPMPNTFPPQLRHSFSEIFIFELVQAAIGSTGQNIKFISHQWLALWFGIESDVWLHRHVVWTSPPNQLENPIWCVRVSKQCSVLMRTKTDYYADLVSIAPTLMAATNIPSGFTVVNLKLKMGEN